MNDDQYIQRLREVIRRQASRPASEFFRMMEAAGIIDKDGKVLVRPPIPPWEREAEEAEERARASHVNGTPPPADPA